MVRQEWIWEGEKRLMLDAGCLIPGRILIIEGVDRAYSQAAFVYNINSEGILAIP